MDIKKINNLKKEEVEDIQNLNKLNRLIDILDPECEIFEGIKSLIERTLPKNMNLEKD